MQTAGIDEAGRGPLAGPVVAAAVILAADRPIPGLADSKQLTARQRERLAECIRERAAAWALGLATVAEIDTHNILQATLLAMERAAAALAIVPERILVDGNRLPARLPCPAVAIVRGDQTEPCISAASILAKTWRDQLMQQLDQRYPHYGFKQHKGYGTPQHLQALARYGACPEHRHSFAPVLKVSSRLVDAAAAHPAVPE